MMVVLQFFVGATIFAAVLTVGLISLNEYLKWRERKREDVRRTQMHLYKIEIPEELRDYDMYHEAVVVAGSEKEAANIHPASEDEILVSAKGIYLTGYETDGTWVDDPRKVTVTYLGEAAQSYTESQVVCSDFRDS